MPDELKPCPFCGGGATCEALNEKDGRAYDWYSSCNSCDIGFLEDSEEKAIEVWNRRVEK